MLSKRATHIDFARGYARNKAMRLPIPLVAQKTIGLFNKFRYKRSLEALLEFERENGSNKNDLFAVSEWLIEEHREAGLTPEIHSFREKEKEWRNIFIDIPGKEDGIILIADHYDTAENEDDEKKSVPGADDNASATAAILEYGRILSKLELKPRNTIRLLHLTAEEYPADCLGARKYLQYCLLNKINIKAFVVMDMIGFNADPKPGIFQLSEGSHIRSSDLCGFALAGSKYLDDSKAPNPAVRERNDPRSYLYNTDGVIFSDANIPTLLFNEHLNKFENIDRPGYHDEHDTINKIDFDYATAIAKIALITAIMAATYF